MQAAATQGQLVIIGGGEDKENNCIVLRAAQQATGLFFTGGDQARIVDLIKGTKLDTAIHQRYAEGAVI